MSTDACFFYMDADSKHHQQRHVLPTPSTSSSNNDHFLVEYSPKPAKLAYPQAPVPARAMRSVAAPPAAVAAPSPALAANQAIHRWLATHRPYSYQPHDDTPLEHSSFSSDESESESEDSDSDCQSSASDSEDDDEEDQIYMAPRRQHSAPLLATTSTIAAPLPLPLSSSVPRRAWPLSAPRPALPVLDRAEATAYTTTQDKSHWSDDEDDIIESSSEEEEEEWEEDDDLPALDEDSGAPASTSTRSLPIPISCKARVERQQAAECSDEDEEALFDDEDASPLRHRRMTMSRKTNKIQDGQSFWTPWIADYMATQN